ncbi:uncharacterized protein LOC110866753 [Helianthus annuus]|uniref:uncharacterized protein LOC110866753 n=1 Tax=Helianthus annuus TaxID=4232 RepID=UPI000B8FFEF7|nr:uncharacterized protein LOC110866753 [Helianthus annuus]
MWCHLFIQIFTGAARTWFDSLPPGKIKLWVDFRTQFVNHFSQQRRYQRDTAEVTDIWRRENEGLEDFITRFNKECLEIGGVSEQLMRAHFKKAIRCDSLIWTITRKDGMPKEWDKLMEAAKIVAQTEESLAGNKNSYTEDRFSKGGSRDNSRRNKGRNPGWKANHSSGYDERPRYEERSRYKEDTQDTIDRIGYRKTVRNENREKHWNSLIKTPKEVLMTENHDFKAPRPMTNKKGQDPNLYCDFHNDTGHLTDVCISLRQEIEKDLKSGKLGHLVKNVRKETRQIQRNDDGRDKKVRRLQTHMVNGPRYSARDKGKRPFEPAWQEQQVIFPVVRGGPRATRPVIITGIIGHYETEYVFVDPGSTADIIYEQCFNQFDDEDKARLEPVDYPLSGFCNEMVFPLGQISFPLTLSDGKHSRTTMVNFMVMPVKSRHDVLIGRETQGELNMVQMKLEDEDKTAFRTDLGIFCYTKMSFGLKNAGATYQRLMDKIFADDIGKHIEVYIDDLVIKSPEEDQMLKDIEKTFNSLRG